MINYILQFLHTLTANTSFKFNYESAFTITLSTVLWSLCYVLLKQNLKKRSEEFCNRVVTVLHGTSVALLGLRICFGTDVCAITHPELETTDKERLLIVTSLGYFIMDLLWCAYYQTETKLMITHHAYSVFALYYALGRLTGGAQVACAIAGMECTNPLLQTRWFLRTFGYQRTKWFDGVELVFVGAFVFIRLILGTVGVVIVFSDTHNTWMYMVHTVAIYIMSWLFAFYMYDYIYKKYVLKSDRRRSVSETT